MRRRAICVLLPLILVAAIIGVPAADAAERGTERACPPGAVPEDHLVDTGGDGSPVEAAVDCLLAHGISAGLTPGRFGPGAAVQRGQMASFLLRTLDATTGFERPAAAPSPFTDNPAGPHQRDIDDAAALDIAEGFDDGTFRPVGPVTRGQMASFLVRMLDGAGATLPDDPPDAFGDDDGTTHERAIDVIAAVGITAGTAPRRFDPAAVVARRQMAQFLTRALDLLVEQGLAAPPPAQGLAVERLVTGLSIPWDLAFTPDGTMIFTERAGALSVRLPDGTVRRLFADLADVFAESEAGLMGVAVDPRFGSANRRIYTCQADRPARDVRVVGWQVDGSYTGATRVADPLVGGLPLSSGRHSGCRLRFGTDGALWIGTGDAAIGTTPQDLSSTGGKVLRVNPDTGEGAVGNPFRASADIDTRRVFTYGHRNVQGLARRQDGTMWSAEHGPDRDDEINLLQAGANHGWDPVPGYNERVPMTDTAKFPGAIGAVWSSGPSTVATSGIAFLDGLAWRSRQGALAVATLKNQSLLLLFFGPDGALVGGEVPPELARTRGRLRAAVLGPDGALYLTTSNGGDDAILRVEPTPS